MIAFFWLLLALSVSPFKSKNGLAAENAALRHQLIVLQRRVRGRVPDPAGRQHHVTCSHRWTASPLHPSLSFRYTQWTSLEPQLTTPHPQPLPTRRGGATEFAALYRIEFWKMDLG